MPSPYTLSINVDIWSTNTDQKLQIMEQLLMLFNPSLEIQTTDNYIDWSSLTSVELTGTSFSSRSIPIGTESEIDIAQLSFTTPIYINMPAKVKKLGIITNVVMSIFDESQGTIDLGVSTPELTAYSGTVLPTTDLEKGGLDLNMVVRGYENYDLNVLNNVAQLISKGSVGTELWTDFFEDRPQDYVAGLSQLQLKRTILPGESATAGSVNGTITINPLDETQLVINWDIDTIPTNTNLNSPAGRGNTGSVDFIIDPKKYNPTSTKTAGLRLLLLESINPSTNVGGAGYDGPDAWKNADNSDFVAGENDIVEWDGTAWHVVFDASTYTDTSTVYITNLNTGVQYKWTGTEWILSFEGEYRKGSWRITK
jgi:hypothetical protein